MRISESKLNALAQNNKFLTSLLRPSFDQESRRLVDEDYQRPTSENPDACRVLLIVRNKDGDETSITSQLYPDRMNSNIPVDGVLLSIEESVELESYAIDEVVTKGLDGLSDVISHTLLENNHEQFAFYSTLMSGICITAFRDPLEVLVVLKPYKLNTKSLTVDWLWFRSRED